MSCVKFLKSKLLNVTEVLKSDTGVFSKRVWNFDTDPSPLDLVNLRQKSYISFKLRKLKNKIEYFYKSK